MNRGAVAEIARPRPRRRRREGRPHQRRARRGVRGVPRRLRAGLRRPAAPRARQPRRATATRPTPRRVRSASTSTASRSPSSTRRSPATRPARCPTSSSSGSTTSPPRPTGPCSCSATTTSGTRAPAPRPDDYFGIHPDDSERLVDVVARHPAIVGYFAGHTHRNRVRRFAATGDRPWVEVACVKDFPGPLGRVPGVRGRRPAGPPPHLDPRGAGVDRADARHVRRRCTPSTPSARSTTAASPMPSRPRSRTGPTPGGRPRP